MNKFKVIVNSEWPIATSVKDLLVDRKIYISQKDKKVFCGGKCSKLDFFTSEKDVMIHAWFARKRETFVISKNGDLLEKLITSDDLFLNKEITGQKVIINQKLKIIKFPALKLYISYFTTSYGGGGIFYRISGLHHYFEFLVKKGRLIRIF